MPITDDEWNDMVDSVPLGKACGPTNIAYGDIKKSPSEYNNLLRKLIDDILATQEIPLDWKRANIYPIPKPKPWGYKLENTRPITLLEIPRKAMMKIIKKGYPK
ncbi:unnamed protein product [Rhizophagus irregularis]|uniref:RNA-directed DNA polymerase from mobile element jockey n=1 Tax=Rhizophagus irregularis TaxID=588596 RepID=A0A915Z648_9GLOM|nr:unnamed protein product [Rhizophagus irregularis]CAB5364218.1 unnamed protein product [Rhizophagus irregularis]